MVAIGRPHGTNDGQFVCVVADVWEPVTDFDAALTPFLKPDLHWIKLIALISIRVRNHQTFNRELLGILDVRKRRFRDGFTCVLVEHRLRVKTFGLTDAAIHE